MVLLVVENSGEYLEEPRTAVTEAAIAIAEETVAVAPPVRDPERLC